MVAVRKTGKLMICINPKDLNSILKCLYCSLPTVTEILPNQANTIVFSVMDARDGFWQGKLDAANKLDNFLDPVWVLSVADNAVQNGNRFRGYQQRLHTAPQGCLLQISVQMTLFMLVWEGKD